MTPVDITPVFSTHYGLGSSILTLDEPGKEKAGAPVSVLTLAKEASLTDVVVVDDRIDGFIAGYKAAAKAKVKLCYGVKLVVCADHRDKEEPSRRTESKVVIMAKNTQGYSDLIRIYNRAWTDGHFSFRDNHYGRTDWRFLKEFWTENLILVLPYFSSFLARNTLTFNQITPDLPVKPQLFREINSGLPFAPLIDKAIDGYGGTIVPTKSIYYRDAAAFKAYQTFRAIHNKSTYDAPNVDHLASDQFSFAAWRELTLTATP